MIKYEANLILFEQSFVAAIRRQMFQKQSEFALVPFVISQKSTTQLLAIYIRI